MLLFKHNFIVWILNTIIIFRKSTQCSVLRCSNSIVCSWAVTFKVGFWVCLDSIQTIRWYENLCENELFGQIIPFQWVETDFNMKWTVQINVYSVFWWSHCITRNWLQFGSPNLVRRISSFQGTTLNGGVQSARMVTGCLQAWRFSQRFHWHSWWIIHRNPKQWKTLNTLSLRMLPPTKSIS